MDEIEEIRRWYKDRFGFPENDNDSVLESFDTLFAQLDTARGLLSQLAIGIYGDCPYCHSYTVAEPHKEDCPIRRARKFLHPGGE